jgi:hypothetical protein
MRTKELLIEHSDSTIDKFTTASINAHFGSATMNRAPFGGNPDCAGRDDFTDAREAVYQCKGRQSQIRTLFEASER